MSHLIAFIRTNLDEAHSQAYTMYIAVENRTVSCKKEDWDLILGGWVVVMKEGILHDLLRQRLERGSFSGLLLERGLRSPPVQFFRPEQRSYMQVTSYTVEGGNHLERLRSD